MIVLCLRLSKGHSRVQSLIDRQGLVIYHPQTAG